MNRKSLRIAWNGAPFLRKTWQATLPEIINEKKAELNAAQESLEWRKAEIEAQLLLLPKVNPEDVERELATLGQPWLMFDWSTQTEAGRHNELSLEQAKILRETLLRLGARVLVKK